MTSIISIKFHDAEQAWARLVNEGNEMRRNGTEQYEISVFTR